MKSRFYGRKKTLAEGHNHKLIVPCTGHIKKMSRLITQKT